MHVFIHLTFTKARKKDFCFSHFVLLKSNLLKASLCGCDGRLPCVLGTLPNLKSLVLEGNPLKSIRRDIIMVNSASGINGALLFSAPSCKTLYLPSYV